VAVEPEELAAECRPAIQGVGLEVTDALRDKVLEKIGGVVNVFVGSLGVKRVEVRRGKDDVYSRALSPSLLPSALSAHLNPLRVSPPLPLAVPLAVPLSASAPHMCLSARPWFWYSKRLLLFRLTSSSSSSCARFLSPRAPP